MFDGWRRTPPEFPALHALVNTTALIIEGTILTPALLAAMTNGDCAAVPVDLKSSLSFDGTIMPTMKIERTMEQINKLALKVQWDRFAHTIKQHYSKENSFCSDWNIPSRWLCFCRCKREIFDTGISIYCIRKCSPESHKMSHYTSISQVIYKWSWITPISEAISLSVWPSTTSDDKCLQCISNDQLHKDLVLPLYSSPRSAISSISRK